MWNDLFWRVRQKKDLFWKLWPEVCPSHQVNLTQVLWRLKFEVNEMITPVRDDSHDWSDRERFDGRSWGVGTFYLDFKYSGKGPLTFGAD